MLVRDDLHSPYHSHPRSPTASTISARRRWMIWLSWISNVLLLIVAVHELKRMNTCSRNGDLIREQESLPKEVREPPVILTQDDPFNTKQSQAAVDALASPTSSSMPRRLLQIEHLTTQAQLGYPAALELSEVTQRKHATKSLKELSLSSSRKLLGDDSNSSSTPKRTLGRFPRPSFESDQIIVPNDLSDDPTFDPSSHEFTWRVCPLEADPYHSTTRPFCPTTSTTEQRWQMGWFSAHVVHDGREGRRAYPTYLECTHLPPQNYVWPAKQIELPATKPAVNYANLRIQKLEDLIEFNKPTPKNLYHFDAPVYDLDALDEVELGERYIPFGNKIRLMLDVGAGGGSLGLMLREKYDVQTLSTVFADWPYCEYITERGGLCILMDVMDAMPAAKFSFDVVHISWVYHGQTPDELRVMFHEMNRVLRPGGYLWMRGGWSIEQFDFFQQFFQTLGYQTLHSDVQKKPKEITEKIFFGSNHTLAYALDWSAILVKPMLKQLAPGCGSSTTA